jgi:hypothetical protein
MEEHSLTDLIVSACKWMENAVRAPATSARARARL